MVVVYVFWNETHYLTTVNSEGVFQHATPPGYDPALPLRYTLMSENFRGAHIFNDTNLLGLQTGYLIF